MGQNEILLRIRNLADATGHLASSPTSAQPLMLRACARFVTTTLQSPEPPGKSFAAAVPASTGEPPTNGTPRKFGEAYFNLSQLMPIQPARSRAGSQHDRQRSRADGRKRSYAGTRASDHRRRARFGGAASIASSRKRTRLLGAGEPLTAATAIGRLRRGVEDASAVDRSANRRH